MATRAEKLEALKALTAEINKLKEARAPQSGVSKAIDMVADAAKQTPLGMAAQGADAIAKGGAALSNMGKVTVPPALTNAIAPIVNAPRAAGVAVGNVITEPQQLMGLPGSQPPVPAAAKALSRGAEALKPGFEPQGAAETIGATVGEAAPVVASLAAGPAAAAAVMGAQQIGQTGQISVPFTIATAITPALVTRGARALTKIGQAKNLLDAEKTIQTESGKLVQTFDKYSKEIKSSHTALRERLGVNESPAQIEARIAAYPSTEGKIPLPEILKKLDVVRGKAPAAPVDPVRAGRARLGLDAPAPAPGIRLTPSEKLKQLALLDEQVNNYVDWKNPAGTREVLTVKNAIRDELRKLGGPAEELLEANKAYSNFLKISGRIAKQLETAEGSEAFLTKLAKGALRRTLSKASMQELAALRALEKGRGVKVLDPVKAAVEVQQKAGASKGSIVRSAVGVVSPRAGNLIEMMDRISAARKGVK
jgi:hypothetical protein